VLTLTAAAPGGPPSPLDAAKPVPIKVAMNGHWGAYTPVLHAVHVEDEDAQTTRPYAPEAYGCTRTETELRHL
jgi:hypothetical protein